MGNADLPLGPGDRHVKAFGRFGYSKDRMSGSHAILVKDGSPTLSVPCHQGKDLARGTLKKLVDAAGVTIDEYRKMYK